MVGDNLFAVLVFARIQVVKSGIHEMTITGLESHHLTGGRVHSAAHAIINAIGSGRCRRVSGQFINL